MRHRGWLYAGLVLLFLLHNDFWWWHEPRRVLGVPLGFLYHVLFCFAVAFWMTLLVRFAWPDLNPGEEEPSSSGEAEPP